MIERYEDKYGAFALRDFIVQTLLNPILSNVERKPAKSLYSYYFFQNLILLKRG